MDTIYNLLKRAKELKEKSQVDSITPEEVGKLHEDTLAYIASLEQSTDGLGIKKVYQSKSAMEADTDPVGTNGKTLRYGQLVSIYDDAHTDSSENGNIYAYQKPGWLLMGKVSGGTTLSIVQELGDSDTKVMSQAAVTAAIGSSKKDATNTRFEDKQNLLGASNVQDAIEKISPYKIYELETLGVYDAIQVNSLRNRFAFGYNKTFDRDVRLTKIAFSDGTDANGISAILICSADREVNTVTVEQEITEFKVEGATLICNIVVPAGKIAVIKHNNIVRAYQGKKVDSLNFNYKNNNVYALFWSKEDSINVSFTFSEVVNILDKITDENGSKDAEKLRVLHNEWQGKHVAFLGDSLTADGRYCEFLCDKLGMTYEKYGVSNTGWIHFAQQAIDAYSYQLSKGFVYDAVFIFGGVNNYDHGATINGKWFTETSETITNNTTFISKKRTPIKNGAGSIEGAINWTLEVLKVCFPNSQIIVMTPTHKGLYVNGNVRSGQGEFYSNNNGVFLDEIVAKIKEGATIWGCPVIDLFALNGAFPVSDAYNSYVRNKDTDHLHQSNLGNYRIAMTIAAAMKSISPEVYDSQYDELNHTVSGTVTRGAEPLKDVNIIITIGKKTFTGLTDNTGRFSVQNITPGIGELILSKGGLTLHKQAITTTYDIIHRQLDISKVDIPDMNINI